MKTIIRNNMRRSLRLITVGIIALFATTFNQSCTNLDEQLYDSVTPANFFHNTGGIYISIRCCIYAICRLGYLRWYNGSAGNNNR